jgi:hypothetical protein
VYTNDITTLNFRRRKMESSQNTNSNKVKDTNSNKVKVPWYFPVASVLFVFCCVSYVCFIIIDTFDDWERDRRQGELRKSQEELRETVDIYAALGALGLKIDDIKRELEEIKQKQEER